MSEKELKDAIERNHEWFMENLKPEFLDMIEGYYNMLQFEIWLTENYDSEVLAGGSG